MSLPKRLRPGQTHTTTRRVSERRPLLRPIPEINEIVLYALGVAQLRHPGVELHAAMVEPNHKHDALTDDHTLAQLPDFYRNYHSLVARAVNAYWGRGEALWCQGSYDNVETPEDDPATLEEQLLYIWTNPVKDGLVERPEDWPGVRFLPEDFGTEIVVSKPANAFFGGKLPDDYEPADPVARKRWRAKHRGKRSSPNTAKGKQQPKRKPKRKRNRSKLPDEVTIKITPPPGYEHLPLEEIRAHFRARLDARVEEIHRERNGRPFMGVAAVLAQDPHKPVGETAPSFTRNPRIAGRRRLKAFFERLRELVEWRQRYREALLRWRAGDRRAAFPFGSYSMPRMHGALVVAPP